MMQPILVVGSVKHDRIWLLDSPIATGKRIRVREKKLVIGGGGFHTGKALIDLGHRVVLVSRLRQDELGSAALSSLNEMGFDTRHVRLFKGETVPLDILLEPSGERTILMASRDGFEPISVDRQIIASAAYVNALRLEPALSAILERTPLVISQLPLNSAAPRPADYIVTSLDDVAGNIPSAWNRAVDLAGARLKSIVVTNGSCPIIVFDGEATHQVATVPVSGARNSIGAGDRFAGALLHGVLLGSRLIEAVRYAAAETASWMKRLDQRAEVKA